MALTLERPTDKGNSISARIDHLLYVLLNRWKEVKEIAEEIDTMDSYEVMDFLFEWNKVDHLWKELNGLLDGGEMDSNQVAIYHALQEIILENGQYLDQIRSKFSVVAVRPKNVI